MSTVIEHVPQENIVKMSIAINFYLCQKSKPNVTGMQGMREWETQTNDSKDI